MNLSNNKKGFTLIELIIIIIILGILAAVAIPRYLDMRQDAVNSTVKGVLGAMRGANSVLWGNRVINNWNTQYGFSELIQSMEMKGGNMVWGADSNNPPAPLGPNASVMYLIIGSSAYSFTMGGLGAVGQTVASPPTTYPQIFGGGVAASW